LPKNDGFVLGQFALKETLDCMLQFLHCLPDRLKGCPLKPDRLGPYGRIGGNSPTKSVGLKSVSLQKLGNCPLIRVDSRSRVLGICLASQHLLQACAEVIVPVFAVDLTQGLRDLITIQTVKVSVDAGDSLFEPRLQQTMRCQARVFEALTLRAQR